MHLGFTLDTNQHRAPVHRLTLIALGPLSAGIRGGRSSINSDGGPTTSVGIPGGGLYYRSQRGPRARPSGRRPFHAMWTTALLLFLLYLLAGKVAFFTILGAAVVLGIVLVARRGSRV